MWKLLWIWDIELTVLKHCPSEMVIWDRIVQRRTSGRMEECALVMLHVSIMINVLMLILYSCIALN